MSAHLRTRRTAIALTVGLALTLAACGGGGGSDSSSSSDGGGKTTTSVDLGDASIPDFKPEKAEFKEVDGSKARFINVLEKDGEGVDIDVYWGNNAETGKKAATVAYGEVTDWMTFQVATDPYATPSDGSQDVVVTFYAKGETEQPIIQQSETIDGDMLLTYTMGTGDGVGLGPDQYPGSLGVGFDHEAGEPPAGKAWVALNTSGVGGIDGGDFMTLSDETGCQMMSIQGDIDTANNGEAYLLDPGSKTFTASDANTDCSVKTDPVTLDLQAGEGGEATVLRRAEEAQWNAGSTSSVSARLSKRRCAQ